MTINSPFDVLKTILTKEILDKETVEEHITNYLLLNYLRSNPATIGVAEYLNHRWNIKVYDAYLFALHLVPKQITNINWLKVPNAKEDKTLTILMQYYVCSLTVATEYMKMLDKNSLKMIKRYYPTN